MRKILFHAASFNSFWAHFSFPEDKDFIDKLNSLGYDLGFSDRMDLNEADYIIFSEATSIGLHRFGLMQKVKYLAKLLLGKISLNARDVYRECLEKHLYEKTALIVAEGSLHLPENHVAKLGKMFPVVFTWNDDMVDGKFFFKCRVPQPVRWPEIEPVSFQNKKLLANISANKYHNNPKELYSVRRKSIRYFERALGDQFDLFGIGWNQPATLAQKLFKFLVPSYQSYKGVISDKAEIYPKYRFALCYENIQTPGYITEKIFDCLRSDCVPIYLGAPNIDEYVPNSAYIDRRQFSNDEELAKFIQGIDSDHYELYRNSINRFLSGSQFSSFLSTALAENIIDVIGKR
jgi:alpha(1,3/1,4) fucosyltransferase